MTQVLPSRSLVSATALTPGIASLREALQPYLDAIPAGRHGQISILASLEGVVKAVVAAKPTENVAVAGQIGYADGKPFGGVEVTITFEP